MTRSFISTGFMALAAIGSIGLETGLCQQAKVKPLVSDLFTADPSAHVFDGKIYIYPSHDIEANVPQDDEGGHFNMRDYHVYSMDAIGGKVTDHGVVLDLKDIPWAGRQLWAPDAAFKNGTYYLYFPVKDKQDVFRIGVATSKSPAGPFKAEPEPIPGSYSIDPAVFTDTDGQSYMYFGGIWGGQLQRWHSGKYDKTLSTDLGKGHDQEPALSAKVAKMSGDMRTFAETPRDVQILDEHGKPLLGGDHDRRFFEGAWMHKFNGKYYFSYSTGDTHLLCYAESNSPYGPFTYKGVIMKPVEGWTTHHSIVEFKGKWYIFYHDSELSGKTHLRNVKVRELVRDAAGAIVPIVP
ncbi:beta-xylosidase [Dyadobacter sp. BE34]|uniref:Beta-xylosidase n=1 Tax=Dyadobacter fermentans TaxID=94254 RepID=A0ABU1QV10_9BACT|nr:MULTISPECIES: glycoside hydrolase family 43 protein [Dyadobacter]MDR6804981.1 beta-xylosidase [Dyadobacter fermentans]MDR7043260.1 beta-xylosidase [Dyadobacter sp. BE242]MDR7197572.1 beta-xylosidase [Dyadobacter sp. BE34]MDR7214995.1 beta-xylosidase [Dyadobacter sp. BE31]MDR7262530.1 beta-xylosidase [Dyadobacter sp. BE32]